MRKGTSTGEYNLVGSERRKGGGWQERNDNGGGGQKIERPLKTIITYINNVLWGCGDKACIHGCLEWRSPRINSSPCSSTTSQMNLQHRTSYFNPFNCPFKIIFVMCYTCNNNLQHKSCYVCLNLTFFTTSAKIAWFTVAVVARVARGHA